MQTKRVVLLMAALHIFFLQMPASGQMQNPENASLRKKTMQGENWLWQRKGNAPGLNNANNIIVDPQDDNIWYVVSIENGLYVTRDGGLHWTHAISGRGLDAEGLQIDPANPNIVYAAVWDKLYKSQDRGKTWSIVYTCPEYIRSVLVSKIDGSIYLGPQTETSPTPGIYKSVDGGLHFTHHPFGVATHYVICWDIVEDAANNILYIPVELADHPQPYNPPLFRSLDGGSTWQNIAFTAWHAQKMAVDERNGSVYFLKEGSVLYRSDNHGANWKQLSTQPLFNFQLDSCHPGRIFGGSSYASGVRGAWMSENGGRAFSAFGLDEIQVTGLAMNGDCTKLYASTWGDGIWMTETPDYVPSPGIRVANTHDSGLWSLREAINLANRGIGADTIRFDLPLEDPGYAPSAGTWTILIDSDLPAISDDSLFIDGNSQQESVGEDTNIDGPEIILTTNATDVVSRGLLLSSAYNRISHLVVNVIPGPGISINGESAHNNSVTGCYLGTDASGEIAQANQFGIYIYNSNHNTISKNSIHDNIVTGILIGADANADIQPPVLTAGNKSIEGQTSPNATIELFSDEDGQGEIFEGAIMADESGQFIWTGKAQGPFVTATATDVSGNTSAFAAPVIPKSGGNGDSFIVTTTSETGTGSITEALEAAHSSTGAKRIEFNIPKSDAGFDVGNGVWTIKTRQTLNITADSLTIDGRSQTAFIGEDSNPFGPEIMFDGQLMGDIKGPCFSASSLVELDIFDVIISRYGNGISLNAVNGGRLSGCYFGSDPSGTDSLGNVSYSVYAFNCSNLQIGATDSSAGNLFSGSGQAELYIEQSNAIGVAGNIIGLNRQKDRSFASFYGPVVIQSSDSIEVAQNTIAGSGVGLTSWQSSRLMVRENYFNVSPSWEKVGNLNVGVWLSDSSHDNIVKNNRIGFCRLYAIGIQEGAVRNTLSRNRLTGNEFTGIYLGPNTNNNIAAPTLLSALPDKVMGRAGAGESIEIFNDKNDQAREYLGTTTADGSGNFTLSLQASPTLSMVTATATDADGNTSALSAAMRIGETGVADAPMAAHSYYLVQNYPNPFNPATTIHFGLAKSGLVDMRVYNMRGEQVAMLLQTNMSAGDHRLSFSGASLPSGVYLIRFRVNEFERMEKIMLLR